VKLRPRELDGFVKNPSPNIAAVLVYGPDDGLVRERIEILTEGVLGKPVDTMRLVDLDPGDLRSDPARLGDEAAAMSLIPGRRVVRVRSATDAAAKPAESFLKGLESGEIKADALILFEAGDLKARSPLRGLFERSKIAAAVPCYVDDPEQREGVIAGMLREAGLKPEAAALHLLVSRLGGDRKLTRAEIEKLILYVGPSEDGKPKPLTTEDVEAIIVGEGEGGMDRINDACADGAPAALDREISKALASGEAPVRLVRGALMHFQTLYTVSARRKRGEPLDEIFKSFRPPLHFKRVDALKRQAMIWPEGDAARALSALSEAEARCKTTGLPDAAIAARVLLSLSRQAAKLRAR